MKLPASVTRVQRRGLLALVLTSYLMIVLNISGGSSSHVSRTELPAVLAHRIAACMAVGSGLLFSALLVVWLFILMPQPVTPVSSNP